MISQYNLFDKIIEIKVVKESSRRAYKLLNISSKEILQ